MPTSLLAYSEDLKMHIQTILVSTLLGLLSIAGCGDEPVDGSACSGEDADINRVPTARQPDWESILTYDEGDPLGRTEADGDGDGEQSLREHIQAWDCINLSWWTPSQPQKVVQVWIDDTNCDLYEMSTLSVYACDSHEGEDDLLRDEDRDGFYVTEGDCNDQSAMVFPESEEHCDNIDNDCDGVADEYLDCEDIEAAHAEM